MKYIITDPVYILNDAVYDKCYEIFRNEKPRMSYKRKLLIHSQQTAEALTQLAGSTCYAASTGFGDWENTIYGDDVIHEDFAADSGMVCVCPYNLKIRNAIRAQSPGISLFRKGLAALINCQGKVNVEFNTRNKNWTVLEITDSEYNYFYSIPG